MKLRQQVAAVTCLVATLGGCQDRAPSVHRVTFRATVDGQRPLAGVEVSSHDRVLGRTGDDGRVAVELPGKDGDRVDVRARCPSGYRTVDAPEAVRLHEFDGFDETATLEHSIECRPDERQVVIVVLTEVEGGLPVLVDGDPQATTADDGVAHILVERAPGKTVAVRLDTGTRPALAPASPTRLFDVPDRDELFVFEPALSRDEPERVRRRARAPRQPARHVPYRID